MDKQTKKRIEELEARVRQLELCPPRLVTVPYDYPYYTPTPSYPAFPSPWISRTTTFGTAGLSNTSDNFSYGPEN